MEYLQRAGQQAVQRSAYAEAIGHVTTALDLLRTLPDTLERAQQELVLQDHPCSIMESHQRDYVP